MNDSAWSVANLLQASCSLLDGEKFSDWLSLCTDEFSYRIVAYSEELRKEMTWLEHTKDEMRALFEALPEHQRYPGKFLRQVAVPALRKSPDAQEVHAISTLLVVHTDLEGASELYAAGRYRDRISLAGDEPLLVERVVELDTRMLPFGAHVPL